MSICGLHGHAYTDPEAPEAYATCDRCGFLYNHSDLSFQWEWRGNQLTNIRLLVCRRTCYDEPFIFNKPIILPPDPVPIDDPRPGWYAIQEGPPPAPGFDGQLIDELG